MSKDRPFFKLLAPGSGRLAPLPADELTSMRQAPSAVALTAGMTYDLGAAYALLAADFAQKSLDDFEMELVGDSAVRNASPTSPTAEAIIDAFDRYFVHLLEAGPYCHQMIGYHRPERQRPRRGRGVRTDEEGKTLQDAVAAAASGGDDKLKDAIWRWYARQLGLDVPPAKVSDQDKAKVRAALADKAGVTLGHTAEIAPINLHLFGAEAKLWGPLVQRDRAGKLGKVVYLLAEGTTLDLQVFASFFWQLALVHENEMGLVDGELPRKHTPVEVTVVADEVGPATNRVLEALKQPDNTARVVSVLSNFEYTVDPGWIYYLQNDEQHKLVQKLVSELGRARPHLQGAEAGRLAAEAEKQLGEYRKAVVELRDLAGKRAKLEKAQKRDGQQKEEKDAIKKVVEREAELFKQVKQQLDELMPLVENDKRLEELKGALARLKSSSARTRDFPRLHLLAYHRRHWWGNNRWPFAFSWSSLRAPEHLQDLRKAAQAWYRSVTKALTHRGKLVEPAWSAELPGASAVGRAAAEDGTATSSLVIYSGEAGSGKTSALAHQLKTDLGPPDERRGVFVQFLLSDEPGATSPSAGGGDDPVAAKRNAVEWAADCVVNRLRRFGELSDGDDLKAYLMRQLALGKAYVYIDDGDVSDPEVYRRMARQAASLAQMGNRVHVAARAGYTDGDILPELKRRASPYPTVRAMSSWDQQKAHELLPEAGEERRQLEKYLQAFGSLEALPLEWATLLTLPKVLETGGRLSLREGRRLQRWGQPVPSIRFLEERLVLREAFLYMLGRNLGKRVVRGIEQAKGKVEPSPDQDAQLFTDMARAVARVVGGELAAGWTDDPYAADPFGRASIGRSDVRSAARAVLERDKENLNARYKVGGEGTFVAAAKEACEQIGWMDLFLREREEVAGQARSNAAAKAPASRGEVEARGPAGRQTRTSSYISLFLRELLDKRALDEDRNLDGLCEAARYLTVAEPSVYDRDLPSAGPDLEVCMALVDQWRDVELDVDYTSFLRWLLRHPRLQKQGKKLGHGLTLALRLNPAHRPAGLAVGDAELPEPEVLEVEVDTKELALADTVVSGAHWKKLRVVARGGKPVVLKGLELRNVTFHDELPRLEGCKLAGCVFVGQVDPDRLVSCKLDGDAYRSLVATAGPKPPVVGQHDLWEHSGADLGDWVERVGRHVGVYPLTLRLLWAVTRKQATGQDWRKAALDEGALGAIARVAYDDEQVAGLLREAMRERKVPVDLVKRASQLPEPSPAKGAPPLLWEPLMWLGRIGAYENDALVAGRPLLVPAVPVLPFNLRTLLETLGLALYASAAGEKDRVDPTLSGLDWGRSALFGKAFSKTCRAVAGEIKERRGSAERAWCLWNNELAVVTAKPTGDGPRRECSVEPWLGDDVGELPLLLELEPSGWVVNPKKT